METRPILGWLALYHCHADWKFSPHLVLHSFEASAGGIAQSFPTHVPFYKGERRQSTPPNAQSTHRPHELLQVFSQMNARAL